MTTHIKTDRWLMRDIEESDVEGMFSLDSDAEVHTYLGKKPIKTMEEARRAIAYIRNQYKTHGIGRWAVIDRENDEFIGWSGLKYETGLREEFDYYDIGYRLRKKYWGQGIATQTATAALAYGFDTLKIKEIGACAEIEHGASNRVLHKIGLRKNGTFMYDNEPHNWYELTREEWLAKR